MSSHTNSIFEVFLTAFTPQVTRVPPIADPSAVDTEPAQEEGSDQKTKCIDFYKRISLQRYPQRLLNVVYIYDTPKLTVTGCESLLFLPSGRIPCSYKRDNITTHVNSIASLLETRRDTLLAVAHCKMLVHSLHTHAGCIIEYGSTLY